MSDAVLRSRACHLAQCPQPFWEVSAVLLIREVEQLSRGCAAVQGTLGFGPWPRDSRAHTGASFAPPNLWQREQILLPFLLPPLVVHPVPSHPEFSLLSPLLTRRQPDPLLRSLGTPGAANTHSHCFLNANIPRAGSWQPVWKDKAESFCPQTSQECAEKIICGVWVETLHPPGLGAMSRLW